MSQTLLTNMIDPEVMAQMITAKLEKGIRMLPYAYVDNTLSGQPGSTITVPRWDYIGAAGDVSENTDIGDTTMTTQYSEYTIKKAAKGVTLTDEAVLSGYGDPVGQAVSQLALSMREKMELDTIDAAYKSRNYFTDSSNQIKYSNIVDAIGKFDEDFNSNKVIFIAPEQVTTLRKDADFISKEKYGGEVMMSGEIGVIANAHVVVSKNLKHYATSYEFTTQGTSGALEIVADSATPTSSQVKLSDVTTANLPEAEVGDYVLKTAVDCWFNPIIQLNGDPEEDDGVHAITIYTKRNTNVETERESHYRRTYISADAHYVAALTNAAKVVIARLKK